MLLSILLSLISLLHPNWAKIDELEFGLVNCSICKVFASNWSWECMARESCYNNFEQDCGTYKNGYQGTYSYILFEVPSLIMGFFVLEKLIILFFNRNFGNRVIFYIFLFLHWILHLLATIIWFSYSNSEFSSARIISKTGPIIAITNIIWQTLTDLIIFYSIHKEQIENEPSCFIEDIKCCKINPRI